LLCEAFVLVVCAEAVAATNKAAKEAKIVFFIVLEV
jgi:hypothetical protein